MANKIFDLIFGHIKSPSKKAKNKEKSPTGFEGSKTNGHHRQRIEKKKIILPLFHSGTDARDYVRMHRGLGVRTLSDCSCQIKDRTIKNAFVQEISKLEEELLIKSENKNERKVSKRKPTKKHKEDSNESLDKESPDALSPVIKYAEVLGSISSKELSYKLIECQKYMGVTERRLNLDFNAHELYLLKTGGKLPIKKLNLFLEILDVHFAYEKRKTDHGYITFSDDSATFISKEYNTKLYSIPIVNTFDFLRFVNKNGLTLSLLRNRSLESIPINEYPQKRELDIVRKINNELLKEINNKGVSFHALANSLHISVNGLFHFLYCVVDYDYKMVDLILKQLALQGIYSLKGLGHGGFDEQDGNLYIILENKKDMIQRKHHLLYENITNKKISDVASVLINNQFIDFYTVKRNDGNIDQFLFEDHVDKQGKRNFHEYDKHELEDLVKWKRCGYHPSDYCDYCRTRNLKVSLYPTIDKRIIQLCDQCKNKIHPTNNYVKIIYTPNGGQNKRY